ncbi:hypothetical protein EVAR_13937_1 [Eumeta japonica]|uniref:Uncharacterized protein n=1 Tax=Eumeta variegata TaxID=151549 RepID=A0A4C1U9B9_EUMVA|nr:hypothetical protein EVAR_13937_1 [Eumeta japonica]
MHIEVDQDERPSQELVRPLPWVLFLLLLTLLRLVRESVSIFNLVIGKPPLHSADVVMFLQSKRRYLRALKYQGSRTIRAKRAEAARVSWLSRLTSLFEFTMCFRQRGKEAHSGNANNEEVLVVRRKQAKKERAEEDSNVDRLIERMLVDLNTDSDDDSSYTLTNVTSVKSCSGSDPDSENESTLTGGAPEHSAPSSVPSSPTAPPKMEYKTSNDVSPLKSEPTPESASTPIKEQSTNETEPTPAADDTAVEATDSEAASAKRESSPTKPEVTAAEMESATPHPETTVKTQTTSAKPTATPLQSEATQKPAPPAGNAGASATCCPDTKDRLLHGGGKTETNYTSLKQQTENFMVNERLSQRKLPKRTQKLGMNERRDSDVPVVRVTPAEDSAPEDEGTFLLCVPFCFVVRYSERSSALSDDCSPRAAQRLPRHAAYLGT